MSLPEAPFQRSIPRLDRAGDGFRRRRSMAIPLDLRIVDVASATQGVISQDGFQTFVSVTRLHAA